MHTMHTQTTDRICSEGRARRAARREACRAWASRVALEFILRAYADFKQNQDFNRAHGYRAPSEPRHTVGVLVGYLNQHSGQREWDYLTTRDRHAVVRGEMEKLVRAGVLERSITLNERGQEARAYSPVSKKEGGK